jgi:hypothetical protein
MNHRSNHHRRGLAIVQALALAVGALALGVGTPADAQTRSASSGVTVGVSVVDGALRLSTENASVPAGVSTISWQLSGSGWRFEAGSIDFGDAASAFSCRVFNSGAAISCNRSDSAPRGQLPYRVRLSNGGALMLPPQPLVYISLE